MCTVTIVPPGGTAVRMACNRDELRTRPPALAPVQRVTGGHRVVMPIDPVSDGTWVAVNDAGLAATLLNVHLREGEWTDPGPRPGLRSRGEIIPSLLAASTLDDALAAALKLDAVRFPPFRLVILNQHFVAELVGDAHLVRGSPVQRIMGPMLFTSSGLGDDVVELPRRGLFRELFAPGADWVARQDLFHQHQWPDRTHLSVMMSRPEACTVSRTIVELGPQRATLSYFDDPASARGMTRDLALVEPPLVERR